MENKINCVEDLVSSPLVMSGGTSNAKAQCL